jgi:hypothetical protein
MRFKFMVFFTILLASSSACSKTEKVTSEAIHGDDSEWVEMDSFHLIMAEAFHPYKDSANLEPVKRLAEELAQEADKWASAPLPDKIDNDEMKAQLNQLTADTRALSALIQGGASDEEIGNTLQALHSSFHTIMEAWNGAPHEHQH